MTQAGGPAAINGFLYQILHHIEGIASVRLEGADQEAKNALLVLEPRNGGDAQAETPDQYLVEQYKTRTNRTWALTDVETILRDLRKAVPPSLPDNALYRFVTDGRDGRLRVFKAFLDALKSVEGPDYLNNDEKRKFRSGLTVTDCEFFDHIVKETQSGDPQQHTKEREVVFHLLSHFEMEFCVTSSNLIEKIERGLRPYVANLGDECGVRDRLVGLLMDKLSKGEKQLRSPDLDGVLREAGLSPERLRKLERLSKTMGELTRDRLVRIGYRHEKDVREVLRWSEEKPVLLITGESGAGKTWQLGRYLEECVEARQAATLVLGAKTTEDILTRAARDLSQRLGYVLMDTFWLLAAEDAGPRTLVQLMAKVDDYTFGNYIRLLPTLGQRSVPILLELLNRITSDSSCGYKVSLIRKALVNLAQQEKIELRDEITVLLNTSYRFQQSVAIAVLEAVPDPIHLDRLWKLHQQYIDARDNNTDGYKIRDYQASFAALRAGIKLNPEWLCNRILDVDNNRGRISELGYLLSGLEHPDAPAIWRDTSDVLMSNISRNKPRSLINCIARFGDYEKIDFVIKHLSCSEDSASWAAIEALTILAPQEAIDRLIEVEDFDRYVTRNQWLPHLLRVSLKQTCQKIIELAQSVPSGYKPVADIFWERPNELDEDTLRFVLRTLETDLRDFRESFAEEPSILYNPLEFLGRIACPQLLKILQAEAGGELERLIVEVAFSRLHTDSNTFDPIRENARRILILMGGQGITTLINRELASEHFWVRHGGLNWAFVRADDRTTIERLAAIARHPSPRDANGQPQSGPSQEFRQAMTALAALGADSILVEILTQTDVVDVSIPLDLADLRAHCGPTQKTLTNSALGLLQDPASPEDLQLTSLVIAWLSGDADLIPTVRTVLERSDPESQIAKYACIALQKLGDQSDDFARLAGHLTQTKENAEWGLNALVGLGNRGLEILQNWIQNQSSTAVTRNID